MGKNSRVKRKRREKRSIPLDERIHAIYDHVPDIQCRGLCYETCSLIPVFHIELANIALAGGRKLNKDEYTGLPNGKHLILMNKENTSCPYLKDKRCSVYHVRPLICRFYGTAEGLPCDFGCTPRETLTRSEASVLTDELEELNKGVLK